MAITLCLDFAEASRRIEEARHSVVVDDVLAAEQHLLAAEHAVKEYPSTLPYWTGFSSATRELDVDAVETYLAKMYGELLEVEQEDVQFEVLV